jgi:hypothetical protein
MEEEAQTADIVAVQSRQSINSTHTSLSLRCQATTFVIGQRVFRRNAHQAWGIGYVTKTKPLEVTSDDRPNATMADRWDEVKPMPEAKPAKDMQREDQSSSRRFLENMAFDEGISKEQVNDAVDHNDLKELEPLINLIVSHMQEKQNQKQVEFDEMKSALRLQVITLLAAPLDRQNRLYAINVHQEDYGQAMVDAITLLDRLPRNNSLEGMKLLACAWEEYDIAMYLAWWYKLFSRILYMLLLIVGTLIAACSVVFYKTKEEEARGRHLPISRHTLRTILFTLPLISSILLSIWGYVNPTTRWRKLRSSACKLESMIWQFRTRTAPFSSNSKNPNLPENRFCAALNAWREDCLTGTDLSTTNFEREYPKSIFKHYQHEPPPEIILGDLVDDFHSPLTPERYIILRLDDRYEFYKTRVPQYARWKVFLQILAIILSACGSVLVFADASEYVVIVSAVAGAATSWAEFMDVSRKLERYTTTIRSIKKLRTIWDSLEKVEKNTIARITQLVEQGESIISSETGAWSSCNAMAAMDEAQREASQADGEKKDVSHAKNGNARRRGAQKT